MSSLKRARIEPFDIDALCEEAELSFITSTEIPVDLLSIDAALNAYHPQENKEESKEAKKEVYEWNDCKTCVDLTGLPPKARDDFVCPICREPLWEPVQRGCCERMVCRACYERTPTREKKCVVCNSIVLPKNSLVTPSPAIKSLLRALPVRCLAKACGKTDLHADNLKTHYRQECKLLRLCECDSIFSLKAFNVHYQICGKVRVECIKCGKTNIYRENALQHITSDCPKVQINCKHCRWSGLRCELPSHHLKCDFLMMKARALTAEINEQIVAEELKAIRLRRKLIFDLNPLPDALHETNANLGEGFYECRPTVDSKESKEDKESKTPNFTFASVRRRYGMVFSSESTGCKVEYCRTYRLVVLTSMYDRIFLRCEAKDVKVDKRGKSIRFSGGNDTENAIIHAARGSNEEKYIMVESTIRYKSVCIGVYEGDPKLAFGGLCDIFKEFIVRPGSADRPHEISDE